MVGSQKESDTEEKLVEEEKLKTGWSKKEMN